MENLELIIMNLKKKGWITASLILSTLITTSIIGATYAKNNTINTTFTNIFDDSNLKSKYENINKEFNINKQIDIEGLPTAKINNGLCIDTEVGTIGSLKEYPNPYIYHNLSLSTQIKERGELITKRLKG